MKSALSDKVSESSFVVLDSLKLEEYRTKEVAGILKALDTGKKALIVVPEKDDFIYRSARNIPGVSVSPVNALNVYDIINADTMVVLLDAVAKIEEVYA